MPTIHPTAYVHPTAVVLGDVTLGARVSVWPTAVIRGDTDAITIGDDSNVQDGTIIHVDVSFPVAIGKRVGIGHRAIIHGATVEDDVLIAMGAIIHGATVEDDVLIAMGAILLNGVHVGTGSIVGAGAVVREGMKIPPNSLVLGIPGRIARSTTSEEHERIRKTVQSYLDLQERYRSG